MRLIPSRKNKTEAGLPSGTLIHVGERKMEEVRINVLDYNSKELIVSEIENIEECKVFKEKDTVTWINIDGLHDIDLIRNLGDMYDLHPLLLEDILNTTQRPKVEYYENYIFFVLKMIYFDKSKEEVTAEQISIVLGDRFVISFQESSGDVFDPIRERIEKSKGRIRNNGADYLSYALMDAIVDNYFIVLEKLGVYIEDIENELIEEPKMETMYSIHSLKREMIFLRKSVWPLREVISNLMREDSPLIEENTGLFLRDLYDHTIQVIDAIEAYRDTLSGLLDLYMSSISNRMNEVMKVLTIIATIFIPLTFIAGIYGMNFDPASSIYNMPELDWTYGYPGALIAMLIVSLLMIYYFRKKEWL